MTSLVRDLKASVKAAKNGTLASKPRKVLDLPEGAVTNAEGEFILPETLGAKADLLYRTTQSRLALQRVVKRHEELEGAIEEFFINNLGKSDATGVAGQIARAQVKPNPVPVVEDWDKFYAYILKNKAFELLQRRIGKEAVQERLDAKQGKQMGVGIFQGKKVSCTKI